MEEINLRAEADIDINIPVFNWDKLDEYIEDEILSAVISTLNSKDKQLLYLKYYENKTDYQLSLIFGVTQQSITERKNRILKKLKNRFRI